MGQHTAEDTKDTVAQVGFMAFMAAALGPAGILVAALAVGVERAWNGDAGRAASQDLSADRVAAERQWLAEDRAFRGRLRADRQRWLDGGADPATRPDGPSKAEAAGRFWRRLWARMVVWSDDFERGFRDGWAAAKKARDNGADWRETARTRPSTEKTGGRPDAGPSANADDRRPVPGDQGVVEHEPAPHGTEAEPCTVCGKPRPCQCLPCAGCNRPLDDHIKTDVGGTEPALVCPPSAPPEQQSTDRSKLSLVKPEPEGPKTMTTPNGGSPNGESNATVLGHKFRGISNKLSRVETGVDELEKLADSLAAEVREASDFANHTGQVAATKQATDAANAVVAKLRALVAQASEAAVKAVEQVAAARASLKTAESAEDSLRAAGGTGDAVATAKAA